MTGIRTSMRRVLRLMREHDLLAPSRTGSPRGPRNHDGTIIPETIDTLWGTDMTTGWTAEGQAAVFVAVDHHSAECVGLHASRQATRFEALEPLRQGVSNTGAMFFVLLTDRRRPASAADMLTTRIGGTCCGLARPSDSPFPKRRYRMGSHSRTAARWPAVCGRPLPLASAICARASRGSSP